MAKRKINDMVFRIKVELKNITLEAMENSLYEFKLLVGDQEVNSNVGYYAKNLSDLKNVILKHIVHKLRK